MVHPSYLWAAPVVSPSRSARTQKSRTPSDPDWWTIRLRRVEAGVLPITKEQPWKLHLYAQLLPPTGKLAAGFNVEVTVVEDGEATSVPTTHLVAAPTPPVLELSVAGQDTSALKFGDSFKLAWKVSNVVFAELWGPLSGEASHKTLYEDKLGTASNVEDLVVTGPMHFTLRARGKDQDVPSVKTVTVGLLKDARGGRVDVWPRQVLPRGPVACHWSVFKVTRFKFHAITGDVVDDLIDAPSITDQGQEHDPSDSTQEKPYTRESFTVDYGPRAGREWTIEAESEPRGNLRALQSRVSAIGVRRLQSSLDGAETVHGVWPYLAVSVVTRWEPKTDDPADPSTTSSSTKTVGKTVGKSSAIGMAAGRFYATMATKKDEDDTAPTTPRAPGAPAQPEGKRLVRREWVAVARGDGLELHVNKLKGERSYKVDADLHKDVKWLPGVLSGAVLGVGAAEHMEKGLHRGECVVVVRRESADGTLLIQEFDLPLDERGVRSIRCVDTDRVGYVHAEKVRVVALWPRVYIFGKGVVHSYDRQKPDTVGRSEPSLFNIASPDWEVVAVRAKSTLKEQARGGYLFALHRKDGDLRRFYIDETGVVVGSRKMASANGRVAKLHDLQRKQADQNYKLKLTDGNILVRKEASGRRKVVRPINSESVLLKIGGALVARSEVHDPSVRPIQGRAEDRASARGLQDRAYNPRLDVWVRCGHPFYEARGSEVVGKGALLATTSETLYCRMPSGEISYISPIEPSHLGFLALDLTPDPTVGVVDTEGPRLDTLFAGHFLEPGRYLESEKGAYRLTYTARGDVVLHPTSVKEAELCKDETLKDPSRCLWRMSGKAGAGRAALEPDAGLVIREGEDVRVAEVKDDAVTFSTHYHELSEADRIKKFKDVRLTVTDEGYISCVGKVERGGEVGDEETLWSVPLRSVGDTLPSGTLLRPWQSLDSKNGKYRFCDRGGRPEIIQKEGGKSVWSPDAEKRAWCVKLESKGDLQIVSDATRGVSWRSTTYGGSTVDNAKVRLVLEHDGNLVVYADPSTVLWRSGQCLGDTLADKKPMSPGEYLESSGKEFRLVLQRDGDLVLRKRSGDFAWSSGMPGQKASSVHVDGDGRLVVVTADRKENRPDGFEGGPFYARGALRVDESGFSLWSPAGFCWWSVSGKHPVPGVRQTHAPARYRVYNHARQGYMWSPVASDTWHDEGAQKRNVGVENAVVSKVSGKDCATGVWTFTEVESGKYTIRNEVGDGEYLLAEESFVAAGHRHFVTVPASRLVPGVLDRAYFEVDFERGTILSYKFKEFLFTSDLNAWQNGWRCRVCSLSSREGIIPHSSWRFERP